MNEKYFDEIVQATLDELRAMSHSELRAEIEKRKKSDFARIFSETGEVSDDFSPPIQ
jgi:ribosomal protein L29